MGLVRPDYIWTHAPGGGALAFNVDSPEMFLGVLRAAEAAASPVILQLTAATLEVWGWDTLLGWFVEEIARSPLPVALQLDHATGLDLVARGVESGFSGVMFDGSVLAWEENVAGTLKALELTRTRNVLLEAEIGHVSRAGEPESWAHLTTVEEAVAFARTVGPDALAVAAGTRHGQTSPRDALDLERIAAIHTALPQMPLVLHGGSGVPEALYPALFRAGIRKLNLGTELRRRWWQAVEARKAEKPRAVLAGCRDAVFAYAAGRLAAAAAPAPADSGRLSPSNSKEEPR